MKMNKIFSASVMAGGLFLVPISVWAQQTGPSGYGYNHGMMGWGGGSHGMIFGSLFMIVILLVVVASVVLLVRWLSGAGHAAQPPRQTQSGRTPLDILKERYARGEIDKAEFEERRSVLGD